MFLLFSRPGRYLMKTTGTFFYPIASHLYQKSLLLYFNLYIVFCTFAQNNITFMENNPELQLAWQFIENTGTHLFLTGKAGTGKRHFLDD